MRTLRQPDKTATITTTITTTITATKTATRTTTITATRTTTRRTWMTYALVTLRSNTRCEDQKDGDAGGVIVLHENVGGMWRDLL